MVLTLAAIIVFSVVSTEMINAQPGASFFQMYVGNYWEYNGRQVPPGGTWTYREQVVALDGTTVPGQTTYKVEGIEGGTVIDKFWYSISQTEMRFWRVEFLNGQWDTVVIDNGIRVAKNPLIVGDSWTDNTTGTYNGLPINISLQANVENYANVTVPLGTYKAYKINRVITIPELGGVVEDGSYWVVPYIGVIKQEFVESGITDIDELSSMKIRKGIVDFDLDAKTDISIYRRNTGAWYVNPSGGGSPYGVGWGGDGYDVPVPGDYDGDGRNDIAINRINSGAWYVIPSGGASPYGLGWGGDSSDIPVPGDYDLDGETDIAVYRRATGAWYVIPSGGASPYGLGWGGDSSDIPVPGDYDSDGKTDIAVYRKSTGAWYVIPSGGASPYGLGWGGDSSDIPVPGDYDSDGKTDIAVYRKSTGAWYVIPSGGASPYGLGWGGDATDVPVPGDYDGDGKIDIAIYRTNAGAWYVIPSSGASPYGVGWGGDATDIPISTNPASYMSAYGLI
jgi:hypothetical protein